MLDISAVQIIYLYTLEICARAVGHADDTARTGQHESDHTDHTDHTDQE